MQGLKDFPMESMDLREEGREDALFATSLATMQGSVQIRGTHHMMMITIILVKTSITTIKGMVVLKIIMRGGAVNQYYQINNFIFQN